MILGLVASNAFADELSVMSALTGENADVAAMAQDGPLSGGSSQDYYSQLEALYQQGTAPQPDEVVGWFSGRCFLSTSRSIPRHRLLVGWIEEVGGDAGPLFPSEKVLKAFSMFTQRESEPADYYDNLSQGKEKEVNEAISGEAGRTTDACYAKDDALVCGSETFQIEEKIRKSGNYLVLQRFDSRKLKGYCYFFKKVK